MSLEEVKFCNLSTLIHCHSYFLFSKINISVFLEKHTSKTIHYQKNEIMTFYKKQQQQQQQQQQKPMEMVHHGSKFDFVSNVLRAM